jgi:hypothetical protein
MNKKQYTKPIITKIELDYSISLQMQSGVPHDPPPLGVERNSTEPFTTPFNEKPFG